MKYIKVTRSDCDGFYIEKKENLAGCIEGEFDNLECDEIATSVTFTVIEMPEEEYNKLSEFTGW